MRTVNLRRIAPPPAKPAGWARSIVILFMAVLPFRVLAIDTHDTRMLAQPAVSADHIAFIYAQDLWVANLDGSQPRRLTVSEGVESSPVFSPDGKTIASAHNTMVTSMYM